MGSFLAGADQTAVVVAGRKVGIYDERSAQALLAFPGTQWDAGVAPATAADLKWAARNAFNRVGLYDELADKVVALIPTGLKGVITIPNIVGVQRVLAEASLRNAGCKVGTATGATNAAAVGQVLTQSVAAGASEAGKTVNYTYSTGP